MTTSRKVRTEELEGLLTGIRHRLRDHPSPERAERVAAGEAALRAGDLPRAQQLLVVLDRELDQEEEEVELSEFPRGLVGYTPVGPRGRPVEREEDPLSNRLLLVHRLLEIRRAQGHHVAPLVSELTEAESAYRSGNRALARQICDRVHAQLDALGTRTDAAPR